MEAHKQLHKNIKEQQASNRYTNNDVDKYLGLADGTYNTKMVRLKKGSWTSISVSDFKHLMDLFYCDCATLFKDVDFKDVVEVSDCCYESIIPETDVCSNCKEHCEVVKG